MMQAAVQFPISVEEYLEGELGSGIKHEYVGGVVYAMAGVSKEHDRIALRLSAKLLEHLKSPCEVFSSDVKLKAGEDLFYYPDVTVTCDPREKERYYLQYPKLVIEVLSPRTERTDRSEKFLAYSSIETMDEYVLVAQEKMQVTVFRRANGWQPEINEGSAGQLVLASVGMTIPLAEIYQGIDFERERLPEADE